MKKVRLFVLSTLFVLLMSVGVMAAPSKVTNVKQTDATENSITISYDAVLGKSVRYKIEMSTDGKDYTEISASNSGTSYTKKELTAATTYWVRVTASENSIFGTTSDPIKVTTNCKKVENLVQTNATTSSITIQWDKVEGATGYEVEKRVNGQKYSIGTTTNTNYTIKGLSNKDAIDFDIAVYSLRTVDGFTTKTSSYVKTLSRSNMKLVPAKVNKPYVNHYWMGLGEFQIGVTKVIGASGYEYEVRTNSNKIVASGNMSQLNGIYKDIKNIKMNQFYKIRVRAFATVGNNSYKGDWSDYGYESFGTKPALKKLKKGIKVSWNKVTGGTSYIVYGSTDGKVWKKVKSTKKRTLKVTKIGKKKLKKGKNYYFKVVTIKKVGKKSYKSGGNPSTSICYSKY